MPLQILHTMLLQSDTRLHVQGNFLSVCSLEAMVPLTSMDLPETGSGPLLTTLLLFQQIL